MAKRWWKREYKLNRWSEDGILEGIDLEALNLL